MSTLVNPLSMRAAYDFLRRVSFNSLRIPPSNKVKFEAKKLRKFHGYFVYCDMLIVVNTDTPDISRMMQIMAHEMIHVALEQNAACDHDKHDENFQQLAKIVEAEMGWPKGSV